MIKDRNFVNVILTAIRIVDVRNGFPRHMSALKQTMKSLLNDVEYTVFIGTVTELNPTNADYLGMSKTTYYKHLADVYKITATYMSNNIQVIGL